MDFMENTDFSIIFTLASISHYAVLKSFQEGGSYHVIHYVNPEPCLPMPVSGIANIVLSVATLK
jgi:hypothetical protein